MRLTPFLLILCLIGFTRSGFCQHAVLKGTVINADGQPVSGCSVLQIGTSNGTVSDDNGKYQLAVPAGKKIAIEISSVGYQTFRFNITATAGTTIQKDIILLPDAHSIETVEVTDDRLRNQAGSIRLDMTHADVLPSAVGGVEGQLKILLGSHNELTSQYSVRGGNYDENLVYVNGFQIYRPFLVRSGQQEGLSFINSDLVQDVMFSVGGFQAKYGDKMSSVLDVTYKRPKEFGGSVLLNLLGAKAHLEGISRNKKFTYLVGIRQKSNQYLLQSQPTKGQYNPSFTDFQGLIHYQFNDKWSLEMIGNYARNRFTFTPEKSVEAFGYVNQAYQLNTFFRGHERDQFDASFAGISLTYLPTTKLKLKLLVSGFQTNEFETYDIYGEYGLFAVESDLGKNTFGQIKASLGSGAIHDFARNYLTANVGKVAFRGAYNAGAHYFLWGIDATTVSVHDRLLEWQRRDSAGYSQPFDTSQLLMAESYHALNDLNYYRATAFVQDNIILSKMLDMTMSVGLRVSHSFLNGNTLLSPRIQYSYKPAWKRDIVFRLATGIYGQPPFYREMRDMEGNLNTDLEAQKSWHLAAGFDYNFQMLGGRPFKVTFEAYYKKLWDLVPYEYDDVRIRYFANNNAIGYAYGGELRLFGDLVKDAESWISIGFLKTENRIYNEKTGTYSDFFPRPTDQRINFGMFFSDYLPRNKNFKMFLSLIYATGLPYSIPGKALEPGYQIRIPDYKRADIGFAALLVDGSRDKPYGFRYLNAFKSIWISLEVFNLLGIENTLSYQWIQDYTSDKVFAVPNRLTSRLLNLKIDFNF